MNNYEAIGYIGPDPEAAKGRNWKKFDPKRPQHVATLFRQLATLELERLTKLSVRELGRRARSRGAA